MPNYPERGGEIPHYRALGPHYIAPHYITKGSKFRTWAAPTNFVEPLNDTARQMLEAWYEEEHPDADRQTGKKLYNADGTPVMWKPHEGFRRVQYVPGELPEVFDIEPPAPDDMTGTLDLAQARFAQATPMARPAPDPIHTPKLETMGADEVFDVELAAPEPKARAR